MDEHTHFITRRQSNPGARAFLAKSQSAFEFGLEF